MNNRSTSLGYKEVKDLCPPEIDVACHNSSNSNTISGPEEIVKTFVEQPKKEDPKPRSSKWVSSSVPESKWETPLAKYSSAEYHTNNLLSPVLFEESTKCIPNNAIVIEIAPHGLLQAIMRRSFGSENIHIPLTLRGHSKSHEFLLAAVGNFEPVPSSSVSSISRYTLTLISRDMGPRGPFGKSTRRGHEPTDGRITSKSSVIIVRSNRPRDVVFSAPGYEPRGPGLESQLVPWEGFDASVDHHFTISLNQERERMLAGHKLSGKVILPLSYLLQITWTYFCSKLHKNFTDTSVIFQDLHVHQHLEIPEKGALHFCIFVQKASGNFEIVLDGISLVLNGRILLSENTKAELSKTVTVFYENSYDLTSNEVYNEMENRGYQYQDHFRGILNAKVGDQGCISTIKWRNNWCSFIDSLIQTISVAERDLSFLVGPGQRLLGSLSFTAPRHNTRFESLYLHNIYKPAQLATVKKPPRLLSGFWGPELAMDEGRGFLSILRHLPQQIRPSRPPKDIARSRFYGESGDIQWWQSHWSNYEVVYQKVTGIVRGGGVEMLGLKTCHVDLFKNNEACVKLESFKFVSHSNPRLQGSGNKWFVHNLLMLNVSGAMLKVV
uniref:Malonyl-CoA:ACP transacylase (MAT) domain-containing protein n=1 Tax=Timema bartmani TaxID=61472 RepID=A0A7R9I1C5_9NEOP|nr:unnamed protein product [Timema bartmani]